MLPSVSHPFLTDIETAVILNQRYFALDAAVLAINLWITTLPKTALTPPRMMAWCGRCLTAGKASIAFLKRVTVTSLASMAASKNMSKCASWAAMAYRLMP